MFLGKPDEGKLIFLYLLVSEEAIATTLVKEEDQEQKSV